MPRLVVNSGPDAGKSVDLREGGRVVVGREKGCDLVLSDPKASRRHAEFSASGGKCILRDPGSLNGTFVGGARVTEAELSAGDEAVIGDSAIAFIADAAPERPTLAELPPGDFETVEVESLALLSEERPRDAERARKSLRGLYRVAQAAASLSARELLSRAARTVADVLEADRVVPLLATARGGWQLLAAEGAFAKQVASLPISRSIVEEVRKSRAGILSSSKDPSFAERRSVKANRIGTAACVPMEEGGELVGVLYADRLEGGAAFDRTDLEFLAAAAAQVAAALRRAREAEKDRRKASRLESELADELNILGESDEVGGMFDFIERAGTTDAPVLVLGESGTGKELIARSIHERSERSEGPFIVVNCAALTEGLVESELFGHVKGAFTGAVADRPGKFQAAHGGSIFLDEVADLPLPAQAKVLRVLERKEFSRVGENRLRKVDIRVIAATNKDIDALVGQEKFREDLFFRLNVLRYELPPLRERGGDAELLTEHFLARFAGKCARPRMKLDAGARKALLSYRWPGNVRELKNIIERLVVMAEGETITEEEVSRALYAKPGVAASGASLRLEDVEREHVLKVLELAGGNKKKASQLLGIDRSTLYAKLKSWGKM